MGAIIRGSQARNIQNSTGEEKIYQNFPLKKFVSFKYDLGNYACLCLCMVSSELWTSQIWSVWCLKFKQPTSCYNSLQEWISSCFNMQKVFNVICVNLTTHRALCRSVRIRYCLVVFLVKYFRNDRETPRLPPAAEGRKLHCIRLSFVEVKVFGFGFLSRPDILLELLQL